MSVYYGNELFHHGIKGQKWGNRRWQNEDGSYTAEGQAENNGHGRYGEDNSSTKVMTRKDYSTLQKHENNDLSNKSKLNEIVHSKAFKIGVSVAVASVAAYAGYKIYKNKVLPNSQSFVNVSDFKNYSWDAYLRADPKYVNYKNFSLRPDSFKAIDQIPKAARNYYEEFFNGNLSASDFVSGNNKGVWEQFCFGDEKKFTQLIKSGKVDKMFDYIEESYQTRTNNCMLSTTSLAMRMKGYETQAGQSTHGWIEKNLTEWFDNVQVKKYVGDSKTELLNALKSQGDGHYGNFMVEWKQGGGHSIFYAVRNGTVEFIDGQTEKVHNTDELFSRIKLNATTFADLTNCNPTDLILKCIDSTIISHDDI